MGTFSPCHGVFWPIRGKIPFKTLCYNRIGGKSKFIPPTKTDSSLKIPFFERKCMCVCVLKVKVVDFGFSVNFSTKIKIGKIYYKEPHCKNVKMCT